MTERARVLCVAHDFPYPTDNGSSVRVLGWLRVLGAVSDVRLVVHPRRSTTSADIDVVRSLPGVDLLLGENPTERPSRRRTWLRAARRRTPPWFVLWHDARARQRLLEHLDWATHLFALDDFAAHYLPELPRRPGQVRVFDKHKVYAEPGARAEPTGSVGDRLREALLRPLIRYDEARTLRAADAVVVTTPEEDDRVALHHGRRADAVIPTFIDPLPALWEPPATDHRRIAWLGSADSGPNRDGLVRFLDAAAEQRRAGRFDAEVVLIGKGVDDEILRRAGEVPITVTGFVPDVDDVLRTCRAAVVPLWAGGGIRVKTLRLLAAGIPVVATPTALEGLPSARHGVHCLVGEEPQALVEGLHRILADPTFARALGQEGNSLVMGEYTWMAQAPKMLRALGIDADWTMPSVDGSEGGAI